MRYVGTVWHLVCACGRRHSGQLPTATTDELAKRVEALEEGIRGHQAAVDAAGSLGVEREFTRNQLVILDAKHQADQRLWRLVA